MRASLVDCVVVVGATLLLAGHAEGESPAPGSPEKLPGLLAYWKLDEGEGTTAADSSANALKATLRGGRWVKGMKGKALQFDKAGDYLDLGAAPALNFAAGSPFTFAGWVKNVSGKGAILSLRNSRDGGADIDITIAKGKLLAHVRADGREFGVPATIAAGEVADGDWHHFALTRAERRTELFLDGDAVGNATSADAAGPITTDLRALGAELIWAKKGISTPYLEGAVDEICAFDRPLSGDEIRQLAGPRRTTPKGVIELALKDGEIKVEARLTAQDAKDKERKNSRCKAYTISLTAGKSYQIDMMSKSIDPYLRLETLSGKELARDDDGGDGLDARIQFQCPASDTYRIVATTYNGREGEFTLVVKDKSR